MISNSWISFTLGDRTYLAIQSYSSLLHFRFDNLCIELDDANACFEHLKKSVLKTPAEPYLLSILQHLACIRNDSLVRPAYYKLIEECVSQIVLHRSGCDPDFQATKRFKIDVEPLLDHLVSGTDKSSSFLHEFMES